MLRLLLALPLVSGVSDPGHPSCSTPGIAYGEHPAAAAPNGAFLASAFACQTSCATNPMCKKFTWKRDGTDACWLIFDADATATSDPTAISGPPICEAKVEKSLEVQLKAAAKVHKKQTDEVFIGAKKGATLVASPGSSSDNSWLYSAAGIIGLGASVVGLASASYYVMENKKKPRKTRGAAQEEVPMIQEPATSAAAAALAPAMPSVSMPPVMPAVTYQTGQGVQLTPLPQYFQPVMLQPQPTYVERYGQP